MSIITAPELFSVTRKTTSTDAFSDFNILFLPRKRQDSQRHKHQKDTVKKLKINKITVKIVMVCEFSMT